MKKKSEPYIPPYKVSGKAMNLIAEIAAAIERYRKQAGTDLARPLKNRCVQK